MAPRKISHKDALDMLKVVNEAFDMGAEVVLDHIRNPDEPCIGECSAGKALADYKAKIKSEIFQSLLLELTEIERAILMAVPKNNWTHSDLGIVPELISQVREFGIRLGRVNADIRKQLTEGASDPTPKNVSPV